MAGWTFRTREERPVGLRFVVGSLWIIDLTETHGLGSMDPFTKVRRSLFEVAKHSMATGIPEVIPEVIPEAHDNPVPIGKLGERSLQVPDMS